MNFLEKHSKKIALALCFATCVPVVSAVYAYEAQPGWHGEGSDQLLRSRINEMSRQPAGSSWTKERIISMKKEKWLFGWQAIDSCQLLFWQQTARWSAENRRLTM